MKKKLRKPKFRPSKRTQNRFVVAFQRANAHFLDGIEHEILFNNSNHKNKTHDNNRSFNHPNGAGLCRAF